jgi:heme/copper-type cytochrome/quinol oxidase subunit 4
MAGRTFDKKIFRRIVFTSVVLNTCWMIPSWFMEEAFLPNRAYIIISGFLFLFSIPFFLALPPGRRTIANLLTAVLLPGLIFMVSTFIVGLVGAGLDNLLWVFGVDSDFGIAVAMSQLFTALMLGFLIREGFSIRFRLPIVLLCVVCGLCWFLVYFSLLGTSESNDLGIVFGTWQIIISIILALGIASGRKKDEMITEPLS